MVTNNQFVNDIFIGTRNDICHHVKSPLFLSVSPPPFFLTLRARVHPIRIPVQLPLELSNTTILSGNPSFCYFIFRKGHNRNLCDHCVYYVANATYVADERKN